MSSVPSIASTAAPSIVRSWLLLGLLACGGCSSSPNAQLFGDESTSRPAAGGAQSGNGGSSAVGVGGTASPTSGGTANGGTPTLPTGGTSTGGISPTGGHGPSGGTPAAGGRGDGGALPQNGGTSSGGAGAGAPDAGSGGTVPDAGPDTGTGTPPDSGGSGTGGKPPTGSKVRCGDVSCDLSTGQVCCVKDSTGMMGGRMTVSCTKDVASCTRIFRCDSDADCAQGEHCCMDFNQVSNTPSTSCVAKGCAAPMACSVPADCPGGQDCCGAIGQGPVAGIRYTAVTCETSCNESVFCVNDNPCSGNTSCQQSQTLPTGYLVCR